jgi:hypothetical protein
MLMKRNFARCLTVLVLLLVPISALAADPAVDKAAAIRQMMALVGVDDLAQSYGKTMTEQIYQVLKTSRPELPAEAMTVIRAEVDKQLLADRDKLLAQIAGIFERNFTAAEIDELNRFYQTELGRKTVSVIPKIMQENMNIGKSWGQEVGPVLKQRLEARFKQQGQAPAGKAGN